MRSTITWEQSISLIEIILSLFLVCLKVAGCSLQHTIFELSACATVSFPGTTGWSGRFSARTGCVASGASTLACATGDCGGAVKCSLGGSRTPTAAARAHDAAARCGADGNEMMRFQ
jgi:hypothetical protein